MSVINKMLRDLDQRSASTLDPALRSGTRMAAKPQANAPAKTLGNIAALWGGIGAALLVMGFAAWWWSRPSSSLPVAVSAVSAPQEPLQVVTQPTSQPAVVLPPAITAGWHCPRPLWFHAQMYLFHPSRLSKRQRQSLRFPKRAHPP